MSLKIKNLQGEVFDLPLNYVIEGTKTNPLFTKKGSQTVPIRFPPTANNRRLLLHTDRLDNVSRPDKTIPVFVETNAVQLSGVMAINAAFSAAIGFDESDMYNKMEKTKLQDIPFLPTLTLNYLVNDYAGRLDNMLTHLSMVMKEELEADYFVFPVSVDMQVVENPTTGGQSNYKTYHVILNDTEKLNDHITQNEGGQNVYPPPFDGRPAELLAWNSRQETRYIGGSEVTITVPKGYGVSPFIKVYRVLELIFEHFGYSITQNPFKEHRQLKKLVVLNNVTDAILTATLHYKDMMPDVTIKGFLDSLFNKFGALFFINSNTKNVRIRFIKDILTHNPNMRDLSIFKQSNPIISYTNPKQLKLTPNRSINITKGVSTEVASKTFEEYIALTNNQISSASASSVYDNQNIYSFFRKENSMYYVNSSFFLTMGAQTDVALVSSDFFDWDKKDDMPYVEIKMDDLCLPLVGIFQLQNTLVYDVKEQLRYSGLSVSGKEVKEKENPAKLAFAFGWGMTKYLPNPNAGPAGRLIFNHFFASQFNRGEDGEFCIDESGIKYDISLICNKEDGLFNRFWKEYDAFLRHSNFSVKCKLKLPEVDMLKMEMDDTVALDNQPLLLDTINYKLNKPDSVADFSFRTTRLYKPYNLEEEQEIPVPGVQKYDWAVTVKKEPDIEDTLSNSGKAYTIIPVPDCKIVIGMEESSHPEAYPPNAKPMLPPSPQQFSNQDTIEYKIKYKVKVKAAMGMTYTVNKTIKLTPIIMPET